MTTHLIGIDPGTKTGIALWNKSKRRFEFVDTFMIHKALVLVRNYYAMHGELLEVIIEKPPLSFGKNNAARAQGAGSVRRDFAIWEDFLNDYGIRFTAIRPGKRSLTKLSPDVFKDITGWEGRTSSHARDAAMLVYEGHGTLKVATT